MKSYIVGFLTVTAFGIYSLPALCGPGDSAVVQQNSQNAIVTGNNNHVKKHIQVVNIDRGRRNGGQRRGNRGVVQNQNQGVDIGGDRNTVRQNGRQFNGDRRNPGYADLSI